MLSDLIDEPYWNELPQILSDYMHVIGVDHFYMELSYYSHYFKDNYPKALISRILEYHGTVRNRPELIVEFLEKEQKWQKFLKDEGGTGIGLPEIIETFDANLLMIKRILILNIMKVSVGSIDHRVPPSDLSELETSFFKRLNSINNLNVLWEMIYL